MTDESNPFYGMSFGRAVDKLRKDPSLAEKFDEIFADEEQVATLERARLHLVNSFYRETITGATALHAMQYVITNPPEIKEPERTPAQEAREAWARKLARGVKREFKPYSPQEELAKIKAKYDSVLDDLAEYERMAPAQTWGEYTAVLGGVLAGGLPTVENLVAWPIRGATIAARMVWGGFQAGIVNVASDPIVQAINLSSNVQKDYDFTQTALSFPVGFVIGGGLVGGFEVVTRNTIRKGLDDLANIDPQASNTPSNPGSARVLPDGEIVIRPAPEEITTKPEREILAEEPPKPVLNDPDPPESISPPRTTEEILEEPTIAEPRIVEESGPEIIPEPVLREPRPDLREPRPEIIPEPPEWEKIGPQKGSNPGGLYKDKDGVEWYIKTPETRDHVDNEILANKLYSELGVNVPFLKYVNLDSVLSVASRYLGDKNFVTLGKLDPQSHQYIEATQTIREDFAIDAWLANWDVIGLSKDNILVNQVTGEVVRIDQGGALRYRAQGEPKTQFGDKVTEFDTMRNPSNDAGKIFGDMTDEEIIASIDKLAKISDAKILQLVSQYGPEDALEGLILADTLIARKNYLLKKRDELLGKNVLVFPESKTTITVNGKTTTTINGKTTTTTGEKISYPMDEQSIIARAQSLGFHTSKTKKIPWGGVWYHGAKSVFEEFNLDKTKTQRAMFLSRKKNVSLKFGRAKLWKVYTRVNKVKFVGDPNKRMSYSGIRFGSIIDQAHKEGYDAVYFYKVDDLGGVADQFAILKPNMVRSTKATFAPEMKESGKLAALAPEEDFDTQYKNTIAELEKDEANFEAALEAPIHAGKLKGEKDPSPNYANPPKEVFSLQQITNKLAERFGETIRQGKTKKQNLGQYNLETGVIRVKEYPDFQVNAHEVAHSLATKLTKSIHLNGTDELSQIAQNFAQELKLLDYDQDPIKGQRVSEGFAEYIRLFMTNAQAATNYAPGFDSAFKNLMETKHPDIIKDLVDFQNMYKNFLEATPEQSLETSIVIPEDTWGSKIVSLFTEAKIAPTVRNIMSMAYMGLVARDNEVSRAWRELGLLRKRALNGQYVEVAAEDSAQTWLRMLQKSTQTAMTFARDGIKRYGTDITEGPSLSQVLARAFNQPNYLGTFDVATFRKFGTYTVAKRGIHLWDQFKAGTIKNPPLVQSKEYLEKIVDQYDREFPQFREAGDMFFEFNRKLLLRMQESGAFYKLDKAAREAIERSEPFYVPFRRDVSDKISGEKSSDKPTGIASLEGSMRDIIHPVVSVMNDLARVEHQIAHADLMRAFRDLSKFAGPGSGRIFEPLPAHEIKKIEFDLKEAFERAAQAAGHTKQKADQVFEDLFGADPVSGVIFRQHPVSGKPMVLWTDDGVLQAAQVASARDGILLYEFLAALPKPAADVAYKFLGFTSNVFVGSITTHWWYAVRNLFRDQIAAMAYVPGYIPGYHTALGLKSAISGDKFTKAYRTYGGVNPTGAIIPAFADAEAADVKNLVAQGFTVRRVFSWRGLAEAVTLMEMATRLGATRVLYNQKKRSGLDDYNAFLSSVNETADMLPFDRFGDRLSTTRHVLPFLNAWMQSVDKFSRVFLVPQKRKLLEALGKDDQIVFKGENEEFYKSLYAWGVLGAGSLGVGTLYAAMNEGKRAYMDAGAQVKALNYVIPVGDTDVFLLPKSWELSLGFTAGEYLWAKMKRDDPRTAAQFWEAVKESFQSPNLLWGNPLIGTTKDLIANYNSFTGAPIVPSSMPKLPEEQYDAKTGALAKGLGKITGWSPKKIDYALKGYFGYWGQDLTLLGRGNQDEDYTSNLADAAIHRAGIRDSSGLSDAREKFWKHMGQSTGKYTQILDTYKKLMQSPTTEPRARALFDRVAPEYKAWIILNEGGTELGKKAFDADARRTHPLQRAYDAIAIVNKMRNDIANNSAVDAESKETLVVNPNIREKTVRWLGQLAVSEMFNALIMVDEPGYKGRALVDPNVYMEQIRTLAPNVAEELEKRYATRKIYKTSAVAEKFQELKTELLRGGSNADISTIVFDVKSAGYEFDVPRRRRQQLRRAPISGTQ